MDTPGKKHFDISFSNQNESSNAAKIILQAAGSEISTLAKPTGKTVGEPNENWVIDNFASQRIGEINFSETGFYEIKMQIIPSTNNILKFQWMWAE